MPPWRPRATTGTGSRCGGRRLSHTMDPRARRDRSSASPASVTVVARDLRGGRRLGDRAHGARELGGCGHLRVEQDLDALFIDREGDSFAKRGLDGSSKTRRMTPGARPDRGMQPDDPLASRSPEVAAAGHRAPRPGVGSRVLGGGQAGSRDHRLGGGRHSRFSRRCWSRSSAASRRARSGSTSSRRCRCRRRSSSARRSRRRWSR